MVRDNVEVLVLKDLGNMEVLVLKDLGNLEAPADVVKVKDSLGDVVLARDIKMGKVRVLKDLAIKVAVVRKEVMEVEVEVEVEVTNIKESTIYPPGLHATLPRVVPK